MTNKEKYQQAFSMLKASRKLEMEDIEMNKNVVFTKGIAVAAAVALCFVGSNSICYAATGATWVEKMIVYFNGEPMEQDVEVTDLGGGDYSYTMEVPDNSSGSAVIVTDGLSEEVTFCVDTEEAEVTNETATIENADGVVWFCFMGERVDITEDFADGEATGSILVSGKEYVYQLTGSIEEYSVMLESGK